MHNNICIFYLCKIFIWLLVSKKKIKNLTKLNIVTYCPAPFLQPWLQSHSSKTNGRVHESAHWGQERCVSSSYPTTSCLICMEENT